MLHMGCVTPVVKRFPEADWMCPKCMKQQQAQNDFCEKCKKPGKLICCDTCPRVYHLQCHSPPLSCVPSGVWLCQYCEEEPLPMSDSEKKEKEEVEE
mmetsp:Transcript_42103/g.58905  ORF Transcript_42103/g.58905 Transcript_42103/m.58905 type:complete len:97 (+) Transcript_42103:136-426(+)